VSSPALSFEKKRPTNTSKDRKASIKQPEKTKFSTLAEEAVLQRQALKPAAVKRRPLRPPLSPLDCFNRVDQPATSNKPEKTVFATLAEEAVLKRGALKPAPVKVRQPRPSPSPFDCFKSELNVKRKGMGLIDKVDERSPPHSAM
jgi:hypothetical protein